MKTFFSGNRTCLVKSDNPKDERITIRLQAEEMERLNAYAEKFGVTKSDVLAKGLELLLRQEKEEK